MAAGAGEGSLFYKNNTSQTQRHLEGALKPLISPSRIPTQASGLCLQSQV